MTWDPFANETGEVLVFLPKPNGLREEYTRMLAMRVGRPCPPGMERGKVVPLLYGSTFVSGGVRDGAEHPDEQARKEGTLRIVPAWMNGLEHVFKIVVQGHLDDAYRRGVEDGKSFVRALAEGSMSVNEFERKTGR